MSDLTAIYDAVEAMTVTVGAVTPTVYNYDALVSSADVTPCRLLLPLGTKLEASAFATLALAGGRAQITWRVTDLCLWAPVGQGRGLAEYAPALVQYAEAYATAIAGSVALIRTAAHTVLVTGLTMEAGAFQYPADSGRWFYGVECVLTLVETG